VSATSEQYAVALFSLASEAGKVESIEENLAAFHESLDSEQKRLFLHPRLSKDEKKKIIEQLSLPELIRDFLFVLIDNNRFDQIDDILEDYRALKAKRHELLHVIIYSKRSLSEKRQQSLKDAFEKRYQREVTVENRVDDSIIGGLRFEFDGKVIDDTVNRDLARLRSRLTK